MKKFLLLSLVVLSFTSCSIHKASVASTPIYSPVVETLTMASLDVSATKITFRYTPELSDSRRLPVDQLVKNAIYAALQANGNADELVGVNYYVSTRFGLFGRKVRSISVSGYPAHYIDYREPTKEEVDNVEILSKSRMMRQSVVRSISTEKLW